MSQFDDLKTMIERIVRDVTKFNVPRIGIVSNIIDPLLKGRILIKVPFLGWDTDEKAAWCYPKDKKAIITPALKDYVIVEFIDGNMNLPIYSGIAIQMKNMIPKNYVDQNTQIIAENRTGEVAIKLTELLKEIILQTGDAAGWLPNVLSIDPLTGVPHGGPSAGITRLHGA